VPERERLVTAGRVGKPHGLDGSFAVLEPDHELAEGTELTVAGEFRTVTRRAGTGARPLLRLTDVENREAAAALRGELLMVAEVEAPLREGEWLTADLVGCEIDGLGIVSHVIGGPSCDVLELDGGTLVPLIADAVRSVDVEGRRIEVHRRFLGLEEEPRPEAPPRREPEQSP
jgi:16S rRNA processing protein RimM